MTLTPLKSGVTAIAAICALTAAVLISPSSAMAGETETAPVTAAADFNVQSASHGLIKSGVKAFHKGNYAKSVSLNKAVIRIRPNRLKTAIAYANLCASYGKLGDLKQAEAACEAALKMRPELDVAMSNQSLLKIRLAEK